MKRYVFPVIAGPTASGKTSLAVRMAQRFDGEVVSADSMQVYDTLRIGTARPTPEETAGIPHHLQGCVPLSAAYSVAQYVKDAAAAVEDIAARGRLPILCGGTGLYISSFLDHLDFTEEAGDPVLRESLRRKAEQAGGRVLLDELRVFDPETADRLHENDLGRIIRAIEVYRMTGVPMSEAARRAKSRPSPYDGCLIVLDARDRAFLYDRIDRRVDCMVQEGLLEEARQVLASDRAATAMQAIGYKELAPWFAGELSLEEALENLKRGTRRYAKRQLSWFRRMENVHWLYIDEYDTPDACADAAACVWENYVKGARNG